MQMLQRVEPYVAYGYPNLKTVKVSGGGRCLAACLHCAVAHGLPTDPPARLPSHPPALVSRS